MPRLRAPEWRIGIVSMECLAFADHGAYFPDGAHGQLLQTQCQLADSDCGVNSR